MREIYLINHGRPEFPGGEPTWLGSTDAPLSRAGRTELLATRDYLADKPYGAVYASTLRRAVETAETVTEGVPIQTLNALRAAPVGRWENLTLDQIKDRYPLEYAERSRDIVNYAPPGGEPLALTQRRALRAMGKILQDTEDSVVVVAHRDVNRAILCQLQHRPLKEADHIPQPYGCVNHLREEDGDIRFVETVEPRSVHSRAVRYAASPAPRS